MKLEHNWRYKTIESLEKNKRSTPDFDSFLITRCHELKKVPLNHFTTEDLRMMISQQLGLDYLIPLALETLEKDLFAKGDFYEGDLLQSVLNVESRFWINNKSLWLSYNNIIKSKRDEIEKLKIDSNKFNNFKF